MVARLEGEDKIHKEARRHLEAIISYNYRFLVSPLLPMLILFLSFQPG